MRKLAAGACLLALAITGSANAAPRNYDGYVCSVDYSRQANVSFGATGYVSVKLHTQPLCAGTVVGGAATTFRIQSAGGSHVGFPFSEVERIGLMQQLQKAAKESTRVTIRASDVDFGVFNVTFLGN